MKFRLRADCTFEAKDIDGAFWAIAKHCQTLAGDGVYDMIESGFMEVTPIRRDDDPPALGINVQEGIGAEDKFGG